MPAGVADFGADTWASMVVGLVAVPSEYWIALCSEEPGPAMDGTILDDIEPSGASYSRQSIDTGTPEWEVAGGTAVTTVDIEFGVAAEDWGLVSHFAVLSAETDGELYAWGELTNAQFIYLGAEVTIPAGALAVNVAANQSFVAYQ